MAVDPTALDARVPNPSFMDDYDTGGGTFVPPPQPKEFVNGRVKYLQFEAAAPSVDKIKTRDDNNIPLKTRDGYFKAVVHDIVLPTAGNYTIQQTHIGTAQYKAYKGGQPTGELRNASPAGDYLLAHGIDIKGAQPKDVEGYEALFQATADRHFLITGDWSAYDKDTQEDVASKWEDFPNDPDNPGAKLPYIERNGKRFWARLSVKRFVAAQ